MVVKLSQIPKQLNLLVLRKLESFEKTLKLHQVLNYYLVSLPRWIRTVLQGLVKFKYFETYDFYVESWFQTFFFIGHSRVFGRDKDVFFEESISQKEHHDFVKPS